MSTEFASALWPTTPRRVSRMKPAKRGLTMFEVHFMAVLPGTTVNTKPDRIEEFKSMDEVWRFIFSNWEGCKHRTLDVREVIGNVSVIKHNRSAIEAAVQSQHAGG